MRNNEFSWKCQPAISCAINVEHLSRIFSIDITRFLSTSIGCLAFPIARVGQLIGELVLSKVLWLSTRMFFCWQSVSSRLTSTNVYSQLKQLNEGKHYRKALDVFNQHARDRTPTNATIVQALKACVEVDDMKRGREIHRSLSSGYMKDPFICMSLIRLYSKYSVRQTLISCLFSEKSRSSTGKRDFPWKQEEITRDVQCRAQW